MGEVESTLSCNTEFHRRGRKKTRFSSISSVINAKKRVPITQICYKLLTESKTAWTLFSVCVYRNSHDYRPCGLISLVYD